ncbi:MAG: TolB family protein, partial [Thermoanaerobaculales bacterium]
MIVLVAVIGIVIAPPRPARADDAAECAHGLKNPVAQKLAEDLYDGKLGFRDILVIHRHPLHLTHVYTYHVEGYRPGGGLYVVTPNRGGGKLRQLVDSSAGEIIDADLSYDGKEVVFSWKRGGLEMAQPHQMTEEVDRSVSDHNYQIYSIRIDGTGLTQLTRGPHNNLNACWLPDGGISFISDRTPAYAYCWVTTSPVLYRMDRDGKHQTRLSANYLMDFTPSVLNDGRILFTRWEYVDRAAAPIQSLWAINPDGTALAGYYGNRVLAPGTFMDAHPIPGTQRTLCLATNHNGDCRGAVCIIDPSKGANARQALRNLTPEVDIYRVRGVYG